MRATATLETSASHPRCALIILAGDPKFIANRLGGPAPLPGVSLNTTIFRRWLVRKHSLLLLTTLWAAPLPVSAQNTAPTVAVLDFNGASVMTTADAAAVSRVLVDMIMTELSTRPAVRLIERQEIDDVIRKRQLSLSGRISDEQAVQIAQLVGANYVVTGGLMLVKDDVQLNIRILDAETSELHHAAKQSGKQEQFLALVEQLADEFTRNLRVPQQTRVAEASAPVAAVLAYSRGLDYERRGRRNEAKAMFNKTLELFPQHREAQAALERVN